MLQIFEQHNPNILCELFLLRSESLANFALTAAVSVAMWAVPAGGGDLMSINDKVISQLFLPAEAAMPFHPNHSCALKGFWMT